MLRFHERRMAHDSRSAAIVRNEPEPLPLGSSSCSFRGFDNVDIQSTCGSSSRLWTLTGFVSRNRARYAGWPAGLVRPHDETNLNLADDVVFARMEPALPEAFVRHELEKMLGAHLPKAKAVQVCPGRRYRKSLRQPCSSVGPLACQERRPRPAGRAARLPGGTGGGGANARRPGRARTRLCEEKKVVGAGHCDYQADLDAPAERGTDWLVSPHSVLPSASCSPPARDWASSPTGEELRLVHGQTRPRPVSFVSFRLGVWRTLSAREVPDGFRLLLALLAPALLVRQGEADNPSKLDELLDAARLKQGQITRELRTQARQAVESFVQGILDHPDNRDRFRAMNEIERERLPRQLWREALIVVYRLLFILRGEASGAFRFATTSPWRHTYSPGSALADVARQVLDKGADTGRYLEGKG